ncbi:E3 ubiquitin-protein ligase SIAH1A-like [Coccinella septempunctata]|uniref:E3 ubiquitin-protein ligase SIAH1A-like n=1 Tax=Coccinella septempunctata TaxID=41139 RepID=UPI001D0789D3|nr:E3 ubiquitin-protein ligase SIAH1A-like [Coccinella septempunctata]
METTPTISREKACPICQKPLRKPTYKCLRGHLVCGCCLTTLTTPCPICCEPIIKPPPRKPTNSLNQKTATSPNQNTTLSLNQKTTPSPNQKTGTKCQYALRGCKFLLEPHEVEPHHLECRFRDFACEGDLFDCWTCAWTGRYDQIQDHFKAEHEDSTLMTFKTEAMLHVDLNEDYRNISLIDYRDGQNFFWYKCKVDTLNRMFYSTVQLIGTRQLAPKYCYEFEIFRGPVRKIKVTETCDSDAVYVENIFENENCVAISFDTLKNYLDEEGNMRFRFRIMSIKKN